MCKIIENCASCRDLWTKINKGKTLFWSSVETLFIKLKLLGPSNWIVNYDLDSEDKIGHWLNKDSDFEVEIGFRLNNYVDYFQLQINNFDLFSIKFDQFLFFFDQNVEIRFIKIKKQMKLTKKLIGFWRYDK